MTWASIIANGYGRIVGHRLMIEGWPDVWVSHPAITWNASDLDGRTIRNGLKSDGLQFSERLNMQDCMTEAQGFTAKIVSTTSADEATASLSRDVSPVGWLASPGLGDTTTTIAMNGGGSLANGYYHIGTEVVQVATFPTIARTQWNTQAQAHNTTLPNGDEINPPVYSYPPTMEGRRCVLYVYGEGDDLTGAGTVVFRGIVTRPPRLARDGVTWEISVGARHALLAQNVAAGSPRARLYGIYHHKAAPVAIWMRYNSTNSAVHYVTGLHDTIEDLVIDINAELETCRASIPATHINYVRVIFAPDGTLRLQMETAGTASNFMVVMGSPLLGYTTQEMVNWITLDSGDSVAWDDIITNTTYVRGFQPYGSSPIHGGSADGITIPMTPLGPPDIKAPASSILAFWAGDPTSSDDPWTFHVTNSGGANTITAGDFIHISGTHLPGGIFEVVSSTEVAATAGAVRAIKVVAPPTDHLPNHNAFCGYLGPDTEIVKLLDYGTGDVSDFVAAVVAQAADYANDGEAPFLCDDTTGVGDVGTWTVGAAATFHFALTNRQYRFAKAKSLREIICEELKLIGHMLYLDSVGRMVIRPLPFTSQAMLSDTLIDRSKILTPDGTAGAWPGWETLRDGIVNHVEVQDGYDPVEDEWTGTTFVLRDLPSIAEHKTRGKGKITVKPYSSGFDSLDAPAAQQVYDSLAGFLARDYAVVTVAVPFSCFSLLVGDAVKLTHDLIPDGSGGRGVTAKRAIVVERKWKLDPAAGGEPGELALLVQRGDEGGYTPSGYITSQSNTSGNIWVLTLDSANGINIAWSQDGDGVVAEHFAVGDYIEICMFNDPTETVRTGTVTAQSGNTVTVSLDASWTPGADTWVLEWPKDSGSNASTHQKTFTYVGDTTMLLTTGNGARLFT